MIPEPSPHVQLALAAIGAFVNDGLVLDIPESTPEELLTTRAGAFVCLKINGDLRGCIGTIEPMQDNLAKEIICNAISACAHDPRFLPVDCTEYPCLECSVDVLHAPEEITAICELDPKVYGVIVESGSKRGLLLPDLEGVDTVEHQIDIARHKAYIMPNEPIKLYRFMVERFY